MFVAIILVAVLLIASPTAVCGGRQGEVPSPDGNNPAVKEADRSREWRDISSDVTGPFEEIPIWWLHTIQRSTPTVSSFSPDGKLSAKQRTYGPVTLWDVRGRRTLAAFGGTGDVPVNLTFSRDSRLLLSVMKAGARATKAARTNGISVWDLDTFKELLHVREDQNTEFNNAAFSPDGRMVLAHVGTKCKSPVSDHDSCTTNTIKLWDIQSGKERLALKGESAGFSPEGKSLLVDDSGQRITVDISDEMTRSPTRPAAPSQPRNVSLTADNTAKFIGENKWKWTVFIKGDEKDIANISCVEYTLHPTFRNPVRLVCDDWGLFRHPFGLSATGWGTFSIGIRVFMRDGTHQDLQHQLKF